MFALRTKLQGIDALIVDYHHEKLNDFDTPYYSIHSGITSCNGQEICDGCPFDCDDITTTENGDVIDSCNDYAAHMLEDTYISIIERYKRQLKDS